MYHLPEDGCHVMILNMKVEKFNIGKKYGTVNQKFTNSKPEVYRSK